ncbi:MAG: peptidase M50 [Methanomicrobiaceae archaeon]|nr:peptidase M50 [Methanomicrobiaceae archaeon]
MLERIGPREQKDLLIAWIAITLAFTLIFVRSGTSPLMFLVFFAISALTVGVGFILHELAHKFTAMRYGYWAEFRKDNQMLLVAVLLAALVGVVFAAPGATVIYGSYLSREQNGRISAAGPLTNLLLCIPFFGLTSLGGIPGLAGMIGFSVNAMIAAFNMLPVGVLDGKKILAWNPGVFALMITVSFAAVVLALSGFSLGDLLTSSFPSAI